MARPVLTVLQVLPALDAGGVERGTLEIAAALAARGHRALVVSAGGRLVEALERDGARHVAHRAMGRRSFMGLGASALAEATRLRRLIEDERVDVLHARSRVPAWIALRAWRGVRGRRPRFVTTAHGLYSVGRHSAVMARGERVIAVSRTVREYLLRSYPRLDPDRVRVIPRGVDPARWPHGHRPDPDWLDRFRAEVEAPGGTRVLTLPGRLTRLKGHEDFLHLVAALASRGEAVRGVIVGDPRSPGDGYARRIRRLAAGLPVSFLPHRPDIREVYAASDLVLSLSTRPESFGRTVLEALSLGVPVAGYDHGGVGEILEAVYPHGRVRAAERDLLVERVRALLADPPPVPPSHPFPLQAMLDRTLALYASLAGTGR